ncbi:ATP-binding protein [Bacteroides acidifaciens]|jgi:predicted HTH transcriptional regulator|uniref:Transcriptional regulator n=2 Tax=Bacteroidaceae TaxID=815 RepID=A0A4V3RC20_9BACE|nr:ATP-binding protein [Bacteroides acidifaciens]ALK86376.1 putative transcriptional regulator [Phocaeicola vulgatus]TGY06650.1 transcriptional regulator [Bacteroides acidifaciens]
MENLDKLVLELCKLPQETGWVEFKHNNCDPKMVGEDISALANSAVIADRSYAYMIWGVDDNTHEIIGTKVNLKKEKKGNQELENWLRYLLSKNADFEMHSVDIDGKHVEMLVISKAVGNPVTFEKIDYIRVGSYTKKAIEFPALQAQLWDRLRNQQFEDAYAIADIQLQDIPRYLNCEAYFDILNMPVPTSIDRYAHYLVEDGIIAKQDNGLYAITNLGAILFAKRLSEFPRVGRKAIRIVQYDGLNRLVILKEETTTEGYAISFENAVKYVNTLLPSKEDIDSVRRKSISTFPIPAIREAIANSLIHQDFFITGTGPLIEVFENRVEVTNSGTPLVDIMRIVDNPPKSRNEKLASLMRRLNMCEELGRGWDRMVISCELQKLPAPRIQIYQESTKVSLFSHLDFTNIPMEDKIWATYLHACIKYIEGDALTNSSLRERFGVAESSSGSISRLIKEVLKNKLIKPIDPNTAPRYMKYIPIWG